MATTISNKLVTELFEAGKNFFTTLPSVISYRDNGKVKFRSTPVEFDPKYLEEIIVPIIYNHKNLNDLYQKAGYDAENTNVSVDLSNLHFKHAAAISSQLGGIFTEWLWPMLTGIYPKEIRKHTKLEFFGKMETIDLAPIYKIAVYNDEQKNMEGNDCMRFRFTTIVYNYLYYASVNMNTIMKKYSAKYITGKNSTNINGLFDQNEHIVKGVIDSARDALSGIFVAQQSGDKNKEEILSDAIEKIIERTNLPSEFKNMSRSVVEKVTKSENFKSLIEEADRQRENSDNVSEDTDN